MAAFLLFMIAVVAAIAGALVISPHKHEMRPEFVAKIGPRDLVGILLVLGAVLVAAGAGAAR